MWLGCRGFIVCVVDFGWVLYVGLLFGWLRLYCGGGGLCGGYLLVVVLGCL